VRWLDQIQNEEQNMTEDTPEDSTARVRRSGGIADQSNGRVREATTAHALLPPPYATIIATPPLSQDVELSWPSGDNDEDYSRVAPLMGIHRAELLIFRREPAGQV
jgi:hypothetical protein